MANKSVSCPICQKKVFPFQAKKLPLFQCPDCQLIFRFPIKKQPFTPSDDTWEEKDPRLTKATESMKKQTFRLLLKQVKKYQKIKKPKLLDVGTGTGALLKIAQKEGFEAIGLEPDKKFALKAKSQGLKVINTPLLKAKLAKNEFDVVVLYDVIEHLAEPQLALKKIHALLKPKGLITIATPNSKSPSFKIFGQHWPHFKQEHLYYFSPASLGLILKENGFKILSLRSSFKALNFEYARGYFQAFPTPFFSPMTVFLGKFLPSSLASLSIPLPTGNMLLIARKERKEK